MRRLHCPVAVGLLGALLSASSSMAVDNGVALTPPMGYNTWEAFRCDISEDKVKHMVDKMVDLGLRDAGYEYFNVDDCWSLPLRSEDGQLQPDPERFPSGIKALADYVHDKGLKFGIYGDSGYFTCAGRAGSFGHEKDDAQLFASWGVDLLKYDNCNVASQKHDAVVDRYSHMRDALNATGRPILLSLCEWGVDYPHAWAAEVGNMWRTSGDINQDWQVMLRNLDSVVGLAMHAGPGGWNDPDMLEVGNSPLLENRNYAEAHFGLWAVLKAPLLISADLRRLDDMSLAVLTNKEVLAINQDELGIAGDLIYTHGMLQVFAAPLSGGARALVCFNRQPGGDPYNVTVTWPQLGYPGHLQVHARNLFRGEDLGTYKKSVEVTVPAGAAVVMRLEPDVETACTAAAVSEEVQPWMNVASGEDRLVMVLSQWVRRSGVRMLLSGGAGASTALQQQQIQQRCAVELVQSLDAWRPWHHGFFGPPPDR